MRKTLIYAIGIMVMFSSCCRKEIKQGTATYAIEYQLPDSLASFKEHLPKTAIVYFKGDSTVCIQQAHAEATTVVTHMPTSFVRVLLTSSSEKYVMDYSKAEQPEILPSTAGYNYTATNETKTIAGYKALKYKLEDKATGLASEGWFSKDVSMVPNFLTMAFDTIHGVPLAFTTMQNGMPVTTTLKQIKFEPVPPGAFSTPAGYQKMTPKQFKDLPVE